MEKENKKVVVRFPPSPTGPLHIGNVRTALFNYLFARKQAGDFIVRVEDTDKARSDKKYETDMLASLAWLGLDHDEKELWHQSERTETYKKYLHVLMEKDQAYISHETEGENREVVRFRNPKKVITFHDLIRGEVSADTTDLGDFIIARNINDPVYHLSVVVDDFEQGITHVIRGEDHISNTPRHILIQDALGFPRPIYAHLPLMLAPDRSKLSKRKHGESVSLAYYRDKGYLPQALVNYLALVGWNPGTEQEIFDLKKLVNAFDIEKVQKGGAIFNTEKLDWINKEHIKLLPTQERDVEILTRLRTLNLPNISKLDDKIFAEKLCAIIFEHINKWSDIDVMSTAGDLGYFFEQPAYAKELLLWKKDPDAEHTKVRLQKVKEIFSAADEQDFIDAESVKKLIWDFAESEGRGEVLWPLRTALSGAEKSPDPFTLASILGKMETLQRLDKAISVL